MMSVNSKNNSLYMNNLRLKQMNSRNIGFGSGLFPGQMEETCVILKPGFEKFFNESEFFNRFTKETGLLVDRFENTQMKREIALQHYIQHKDKSFYNEAVDYISEGPICLIKAKGIDAIDKARSFAKKLRSEYVPATEKTRNLIHTSDVPDTAKTAEETITNAERELKLHGLK